MSKYKMEIKNPQYVLLFAVMFFPFCVAGTFSYTIPIVYTASIYLRYIFCLILAIASFRIWFKKKVISLVLLTAVFLLILFASTVLNIVDKSAFLSYAVKCVFLLLYFCMASYVYTEEMLSAAWWVCFVLTAINILSILFYPEGLYLRDDLFTSGREMAYWFLGNRNLFVDYLFPMVVTSLLLQYIKKGSYIRFYISIFTFVLTVILTGSATTILVLAIIIVYFLFVRRGHLKRLVNPYFLSIFYGVVSVVIILLSNVSLFSLVIVKVLKKDLTMSSRTTIWKNVLTHIRQNPWKGYGYRSGDNFIDNSIVMHAHNLFLHMAYSGGIFALVPLLAILVICVKKIRDIKQNTILYVMMSSLFFAYLWMEFSEPRIYFPFLFAMVALIWNLPAIIEQRRNRCGGDSF